MTKKRRVSFKLIYLIYVLLLAALVAAAVLYVRSLLFEYEAAQPELQAQIALSQLIADADDADSFWAGYGLPTVAAGPLEQHTDIRQEYLSRYRNGEPTLSLSGSSEDALFYNVENDGLLLAKITLEAAGPAVTRLAVLSLREWAVESVTPVLEPQSWVLTVPNSFDVQVNGVALTAADGTPDGDRRTEYTLAGLYLTPELVITDTAGSRAEYSLKNGRVFVDFTDYSLTLPAELTVEIDGRPLSGADAGSGLIRYDIVTLSKPRVCICDDYGNTVEYQGGSELPLTQMTLVTDSRYTVLVDGAAVPEHRITRRANPEYAALADYVPNLPGFSEHRITVLRDNAAIAVTNEVGNPVFPQGGQAIFVNAQEVVPDDVAAQVDVLQIAQMWSMFMTDDLPFEEMEPHLIAGSYQHKMALNYATGVDIKYTSKHTLADPAFTENSVTNFVWLTEDCFHVDISFVKHMRLYYGAMVDDPMNHRFYFVRYDDTDNGVDDPTWKLVSMKEIV